MSLITIIWSMVSAICLTLAAVHFFVWLNARNRWDSLLFCIMATAAASLNFQELLLMRSQTADATAELLRWMHVSVAIIIISLVWFIRHYLRAGRKWLAMLISGLRVTLLVPNFTLGSNSTFHSMQSPRQMSFLGEMVSVPLGEPSSWRLLTNLSAILFLIYVLDAVVASYRRHGSQRSLILGTAILTTAILSITFSQLMVRGVLPGPFVGIVFLFIVLAITFDLGVDLLRAETLSQDLLESQARIDLAARAANLTIWQWDIIRDRVWVTGAAAKAAAVQTFEPGTLNRYLELVHPEDRNLVHEAVHLALDGQKPLFVEFRQLSTDGHVKWNAAFGEVVHDRHRRPLRLRGVSIDISGRKEVEAKIQKQWNELAHLQRVAAMGQLSTALAHEINQPLGSILRNAEAAELILRQASPDLKELEEIISDIQADEHRAAAIIGRMRSFLRRRQVTLDEISVDQLINSVVSLLRNEIRSKDISLLTKVEKGLPRVLVDPIQTQQVMINLLMNSFDALESKEDAAREIKLRASQSTDTMVLISVADNGPGIAPERLPHLFEPFFTNKLNGTGVGLAISRDIIEAHGGKIWAENNPDGGAKFQFTVPVARKGGGA